MLTDVNLMGEARKAYMEKVAKKSVNLSQDERKSLMDALMKDSVQAMEAKQNREYSQRGDDYLLEAWKVCEKEKPAPRCPYCGNGNEMKKRVLSDYKTLCFWLCPKCSATSPSANTAEDAYATAMQRWQEPNRVLTIGEVQGLAYGEYVFSPCVIVHDSLSMVGILELYDGASMKLMEKSMYGKRWRCWLRKPTREEMEAVPWEGD